MAFTDGTWIGGSSTDWTTGFNWLDQIPAQGDGMTVSIVGTGTVPVDSRPSSGVVHFVVATGVTVTLAAWLNGASIGNVTNAGTVMGAASSTTVFGGNITNTGTLDFSASGASLDVNGAAGITGDGGTIKLSATSAGTGILNVTNCTWAVAVGATWTADLGGTLSVGTASNLAVNVNYAGTTTLGTSLAVRTFDVATGATVAGAGKTLTLGAGGMTWTTTGVINGQTLSLVLAASCTISQRGTNMFVSTTVPAGVTLAVGASSEYGHYTRAVAGAGTVATAASSGLIFMPSGNDTWTFTGTINCILEVVVTAGVANLVNTLPLNTNNQTVIWRRNDSVADTMTIGGMNLGTGTLNLYGPAGGQLFTGQLTGPLKCGPVNLGVVAALARVGKLVMCDGVVNEIGALARGAGNTGTANAITYAGTVKLGGAQTLASLAVDFGGAALIANAAAVTVTGQTATSVTHAACCMFSNGAAAVLTVDYLPAQATPIQVYCGALDGEHNTPGSVVFHPGPPDDY